MKKLFSLLLLVAACSPDAVTEVPVEEPVPYESALAAHRVEMREWRRQVLDDGPHADEPMPVFDWRKYPEHIAARPSWAFERQSITEEEFEALRVEWEQEQRAVLRDIKGMTADEVRDEIVSFVDAMKAER